MINKAISIICHIYEIKQLENQSTFLVLPSTIVKTAKDRMKAKSSLLWDFMLNCIHHEIWKSLYILCKLSVLIIFINFTPSYINVSELCQLECYIVTLQRVTQVIHLSSEYFICTVLIILSFQQMCEYPENCEYMVICLMYFNQLKKRCASNSTFVLLRRIASWLSWLVKVVISRRAKTFNSQTFLFSWSNICLKSNCHFIVRQNPIETG